MKTKTLFHQLLFITFALILFGSCTNNSDELSIDFEKYTLSNGMDVILHQDKSDPIVAVAIQYHVGSNREKPGKTGFAHLFEHMMFQESENVPQDQFFKKIQSAGGTLNGGTSHDGTLYFEVVPKNAAEMVLWMESDRLGYLSNTVTQPAFANQQDVVLNEKRQRVDNNPYGHNYYVIHQNLFPKSHPYNWTVIGEMEDLFNATVEDVVEFHDAFYVPNNATLVIAGDFETEDMKAMVEKYFGEIPGGELIEDMEPMPVTLSETKRIYHEDNFAKTPLLTLTWPTVENYHPDAYALDFLAQILGQGKKAPFYKVLVKDKKITSRASVYNSAMELCGKFTVSVPANTNISLVDAEAAINDAFALFEEEGITDIDLEKIKAGLETSFYNGISSVLGKSFQMARYNEYAGDPGFIKTDIENIKAVSKEEVLAVYEKYIKNKPFILTSFVPKGQIELSAENCIKAEVVEESADDVVKVADIAYAEEEIIKTPGSFDRSIEPTKGPDPLFSAPEVWKSSLSNEMKVMGIEHHELPLIQYSITMDGGHFIDPENKSGVASLVATMLMEGTANKTPEELEEAIDMLGANIRLSAGLESLTINVNALARNLDETIELVQEILLEPRWDTEEFEIAKMKVVNNLKRNAANPNYLSQTVFNNLLFGKGTILASGTSGTVESISNITLDDLKEYYATNVSPSVASLHIVGDIDQKGVEGAFASLAVAWEPKEVSIPKFEVSENPLKSKIYFVDMPGAKQSVIRIGNIYLPENYNDHYATTVVNYKLGGGFNGNLNMILREEKGFTYGARSGFDLNNTCGTFYASSSVRSDATLESMHIFHDQMANYREGIPEEDLTFTKDALLKSKARDYETLGALKGMLSQIDRFDLPSDYINQEQKILTSMTLETHKKIAQKYINPDAMFYLVVGDAATQLKPLEELGYGKAVLIAVD
jgi:zinc protease